MNEKQIQGNNPQLPEEQEIDLIELVQRVWAEKKLLFKVCGIAAVVGLVMAFSIPKEYTTSVKMVHESGGHSGLSGMGALASMAGINLNGQMEGDALSPDLYPDILTSIPFLTELFDVHVVDEDAEIDTTLYVYLDEYQRGTWWGAIIGAPFELLGWIIDLFADDNDNHDLGVNTFQLTKDESYIVEALSDRISLSADKKTGTITLKITMQDPLISATMADTVTQRLQQYITNYRTNKARHDLVYTELLYEESRQNYYDAQQKYAEYTDGNQNIVLRSYRTEMERLQNEMTVAYGIYNQMAQQLQMSKAKVLEITPVYTVVQPATVPLKAAKPKKLLMLIGFIFLGGAGCVAWILFGREFVAKLKKKEE